MHRPFLLPILLLAAALGSLAASPPAQPGKRKVDPERGKELYDRYCWSCHGRTGLGDGPSAAAVSPAAPNLRNGLTTERFPELVPVILAGRGAMPAYSELIDRWDSRRILVWLVSLDAPETPKSDDDEEQGADNDAAPGGEG